MNLDFTLKRLPKFSLRDDWRGKFSPSAYKQRTDLYLNNSKASFIASQFSIDGGTNSVINGLLNIPGSIPRAIYDFTDSRDGDVTSTEIAFKYTISEGYAQKVLIVVSWFMQWKAKGDTTVLPNEASAPIKRRLRESTEKVVAMLQAEWDKDTYLMPDTLAKRFNLPTHTIYNHMSSGALIRPKEPNWIDVLAKSAQPKQQELPQVIKEEASVPSTEKKTKLTFAEIQAYWNEHPDFSTNLLTISLNLSKSSVHRWVEEGKLEKPNIKHKRFEGKLQHDYNKIQDYWNQNPKLSRLAVERALGIAKGSLYLYKKNGLIAQPTIDWAESIKEIQEFWDDNPEYTYEKIIKKFNFPYKSLIFQIKKGSIIDPFPILHPGKTRKDAHVEKQKQVKKEQMQIIKEFWHKNPTLDVPQVAPHMGKPQSSIYNYLKEDPSIRPTAQETDTNFYKINTIALEELAKKKEEEDEPGIVLSPDALLVIERLKTGPIDVCEWYSVQDDVQLIPIEDNHVKRRLIMSRKIYFDVESELDFHKLISKTEILKNQIGYTHTVTLDLKKWNGIKLRGVDSTEQPSQPQEVPAPSTPPDEAKWKYIQDFWKDDPYLSTQFIYTHFKIDPKVLLNLIYQGKIKRPPFPMPKAVERVKKAAETLIDASPITEKETYPTVTITTENNNLPWRKMVLNAAALDALENHQIASALAAKFPEKQALMHHYSYPLRKLIEALSTCHWFDSDVISYLLTQQTESNQKDD